MELADALTNSAGDPVRSWERPASGEWYDPDSAAYLASPERASDGWTRITPERRQEIVDALPAGLRPLSLLVRVRREIPAPR
jgi:hypothetical protein